MRILPTCSSIVLLAVIAGAMTASTGADAIAATICPQFLAKYCVIEQDGKEHTVATNPCFAKEKGWRIVNAGACRTPK